MATKTISLNEEAYEQLKARKREGESFSDVVKRLTRERSWSEGVGILDEEEAEAQEATFEEGGPAHTGEVIAWWTNPQGTGVTKNQNG